MIEHDHDRLISAVFITFSGNCKKALHFYQTCFGGRLQFEIFDKEIQGYTERPVISGSLVSDRIIIYGSDLVHNEGRKLGNYISIFLHCKNIQERGELIKKLEPGKKDFLTHNDEAQKLVELTDGFDLRWVLAV